MESIIYKNKEAIYFSEIVEMIGVPRGTLCDFVRRKKLKTIGKLGSKTVIAVDDLRHFLNSRFYFKYLSKRPDIKIFQMPQILNVPTPPKEEEKKEEYELPLNLKLQDMELKECKLEFFPAGAIERKKTRVTVQLTKDLYDRGDLDSLLDSLSQR